MKPVLSGPHIKRTPASVPKYASHIYCKMNLYLYLYLHGHRIGADLSPKTCIERTLQKIIHWIFVILYKDCAVLTLSRPEGGGAGGFEALKTLKLNNSKTVKVMTTKFSKKIYLATF